MLARTLARPSRIAIFHQSIRKTAPGPTLLQYRPFRSRRRQYTSSAGNTIEGHNGEQNHAPRGSLRPFTVLILCIPLGYGVNWALKQQNGAGQASPDGFVKYTMATKEPVSSTCAVFTLIPSSPNVAINTTAPELARSVTSVQFKQPQLQIARSYTLLPRTAEQDEDEVRFLIKKEQKGEVSGYLHQLPLDAEAEVRGVSQEYAVPEGVQKVVFLAGGTGIAPAMQIAGMLKDEKVDVHILWANRKREDCAGGRSDTLSASSTAPWWSLSRLWSSRPSDMPTPPSVSKHQIVRELDEAKGVSDAIGRNLLVDYFVDEENTLIRPGVVNGLLRDPTSGKKLLIVSGPEGFINYWAGPKQWLDGREVQGPLAGALGRMDTTGWEIVKL